VIELSGITKTYADGHEALRGIDLVLDDTLFGLLGPNGAGKTTLLSILVLGIEPSSGTRRYDGLDPTRRGTRSTIRRTIGYLPQDFRPVGHLTGIEYLTHCARLREVSLTRHELDRRARLLIDAVGLQDAARRASGTYSGGMRRRLGIAQALIHAPKLLVVDEPTAGLDPDERIRFRNLIAEAAEEVTILLSTHITEDIETTCDRIGVLHEGRFVFDGRPSALIGDESSSLEDAYRATIARQQASAA
jgi:ABC-type multidrug transport system ATPase subunit